MAQIGEIIVNELKKMSVTDMTQAQISARLAEIHETLLRMTELADGIMYNDNLDNIIKGVFLDCYECKLDTLKDELFDYTEQILNEE